jgi:hypothetical protein
MASNENPRKITVRLTGRELGLLKRSLNLMVRNHHLLVIDEYQNDAATLDSAARKLDLAIVENFTPRRSFGAVKRYFAKVIPAFIRW